MRMAVSLAPSLAPSLVLALVLALVLSLVLALTVALSGCENPPEPAPPAAGAAPSARTSPTPAPAPATLEGAWRVAGIDGRPLDESYGLALTADGQEIWWEPRCFGMIRGYTISGNAFMAGPRVTSEPAATSTPAPRCLIAPPPRLMEVSEVLQAANRIETTPENGVLISGQGRALLLFSQ